MKINELVIFLLNNPEVIDRLIKSLDNDAIGYDGYEYGLPTASDAHMAQLRESVLRWVASIADVDIEELAV